MPDKLLDTIADGNEEVDSIARERNADVVERTKDLLTAPGKRSIFILHRMLSERAVRTAELHGDEESALRNAAAIAEVAVMSFDEAMQLPPGERDGNYYSGVAVMVAWCQRQAFAEIMGKDIARAALENGKKVHRQLAGMDRRAIVRIARESEPDDKGKRKPLIDGKRRQAAKDRRASVEADGA